MVEHRIIQPLIVRRDGAYGWCRRTTAQAALHAGLDKVPVVKSLNDREAMVFLVELRERILTF